MKPAVCLRLCALSLCLTSWLPITVVHAQPVASSPAQAAQEGLRREEERARSLRQQQLHPRAVHLRPGGPGEAAETLAEETPCFIIGRIALAGPDATRFGWLADSASAYIGQCAGVAGLRQIASALDGALIELGYITSRVGMPQQNLADGTLVFTLHMGRVAEISLLDASGERLPDQRWGTWRNAFPIAAGDILNVRDLEQGVEQMKRLPSQSVSTELEPGTRSNTSNVAVLRQAGTLTQRMRAGATLDNSGSQLLGRPQLAGFLSFDNPLGLNDIVSLSVSSNLQGLRSDHRSQSLSFHYSVPWGYNTFTLSRSQSRFAQIVQGTSVDFLSSGRSESTELRADRTLLRASASRFGAWVAVGTRRANSFLDDVELIVQRARTTTLEVGAGWRYLANTATFDFQLGHRRGMPWQGAQDDYATAALGGLTVRPRITTLSGAVTLPFKLAGYPIRYSGTVRAQHTADTTLSVDQIAIGNRFSVRGFDGDRVLIAESGYFIRNEFSMPIPLHTQLSTVAFAGLDFGRVFGPSAALLTGNRLAGAAVGVRGQYRGLQFDVAVATPLAKPDGFRTRHWNPYLSLTSAF